MTKQTEREIAGRKLYEQETDNDPIIHCNRFPAWHELKQERRDEYTRRAEWMRSQQPSSEAEGSQPSVADELERQFKKARCEPDEARRCGEYADVIRNALATIRTLEAQLAESERAVCTALGMSDTENINDALIEIDSLRDKLAARDEQIVKLREALLRQDIIERVLWKQTSGSLDTVLGCKMAAEKVTNWIREVIDDKEYAAALTDTQPTDSREGE